MSVSVTKTSKGYDVTLNGKTVTLPLDMKKTEDRARGVMMFGTDRVRLEVNTYSNEITLVEKEETEVLVPDDGTMSDDERDALVGQFIAALAEAQSGSSRRRSRRSRVNRKTRRSKGKRRQTKRR